MLELSLFDALDGLSANRTRASPAQQVGRVLGAGNRVKARDEPGPTTVTQMAKNQGQEEEQRGYKKARGNVASRCNQSIADGLARSPGRKEGGQIRSGHLIRTCQRSR